MSSPTAIDKTSSDDSLEIAARLALNKFRERQRVLNQELNILEREIDATMTALKKKKVKNYIDTLNV